MKRIRCGLVGEHEIEVAPWDIKNNPYFREWVEASASAVGGFIHNFEARERCVSKYGFAVPHFQSLMSIKRNSTCGVLEIGAGTGYWAHLLQKLGLVVAAVDGGSGSYGSHSDAEPWRKPYTDIMRATHKEALGDHALREALHQMTLFLCWPDYQGEWAREAVQLYTGPTLIYVGEASGGCCAEGSFFDELDVNWVEVENVSIPQWWGIHDELWVYHRRKP